MSRSCSIAKLKQFILKLIAVPVINNEKKKGENNRTLHYKTAKYRLRNTIWGIFRCISFNIKGQNKDKAQIS